MRKRPWYPLVLAGLSMALVLPSACDISSPTRPDPVIVQADISSVGLVILYRDQSEPQDKYERIDYELQLRGAHVSSGSAAKHKETPITVTQIGDYTIIATARTDNGDPVGTGVFGITVTGL